MVLSQHRDILWKIFSLKMEQTNTGNEKFERERGKERERV